ncbi:peptidyl-prolyl cis-trans isomerase cyp63 [Anaeramoeba flamelloides]|uniref:Peptidyl-prolyl cis-trans isomerase cyp63 n=1 Tax=Anaeramoeba flamelloides TaxID=1746091 RepID=A0AAV8A5K2_9EUKA|nr:peptidyl-prolyl cis-trans isomerase cyp63 [Anaeramoeba flamelloides]
MSRTLLALRRKTNSEKTNPKQKKKVSVHFTELAIWMKTILLDLELTESELLSKKGIYLLNVLHIIAPTELVEFVQAKTLEQQIKKNLEEVQETLIKRYHYPGTLIFKVPQVLKNNGYDKRYLKSVKYLKSYHQQNGECPVTYKKVRQIWFLKNEIDSSNCKNQKLLKPKSKKFFQNVTIKNEFFFHLNEEKELEQLKKRTNEHQNTSSEDDNEKETETEKENKIIKSKFKTAYSSSDSEKDRSLNKLKQRFNFDSEEEDNTPNLPTNIVLQDHLKRRKLPKNKDQNNNKNNNNENTSQNQSYNLSKNEKEKEEEEKEKAEEKEKRKENKKESKFNQKDQNHENQNNNKSKNKKQILFKIPKENSKKGRDRNKKQSKQKKMKISIKEKRSRRRSQLITQQQEFEKERKQMMEESKTFENLPDFSSDTDSSQDDNCEPFEKEKYNKNRIKKENKKEIRNRKGKGKGKGRGKKRLKNKDRGLIKSIIDSPMPIEDFVDYKTLAHQPKPLIQQKQKKQHQKKHKQNNSEKNKSLVNMKSVSMTNFTKKKNEQNRKKNNLSDLKDLKKYKSQNNLQKNKKNENQKHKYIETSKSKQRKKKFKNPQEKKQHRNSKSYDFQNDLNSSRFKYNNNNNKNNNNNNNKSKNKTKNTNENENRITNKYRKNNNLRNGKEKSNGFQYPTNIINRNYKKQVKLYPVFQNLELREYEFLDTSPKSAYFSEECGKRLLKTLFKEGSGIGVIEVFFLLNTFDEWSHTKISKMNLHTKILKFAKKIEMEFAQAMELGWKWCRISDFDLPTEIDNTGNKLFRSGNLWIARKKLVLSIDGIGKIFEFKWDQSLKIFLDKNNLNRFLIINNKKEQIYLRAKSALEKRMIVFVLLIYSSSNGKNPLIGHNPKISINDVVHIDITVLPPFALPNKKRLKFLITLEDIITNYIDGKNSTQSILQEYWKKGKIIFQVHIVVGRVVPFESGFFVISKKGFTVLLGSRERSSFKFKNNVKISKEIDSKRLFRLNLPLKKSQKGLNIIRLVARSQIHRDFIFNASSYFQKIYF